MKLKLDASPDTEPEEEEDECDSADDWLEEEAPVNEDAEVPVSSKELFEEKFKSFDEEWQQLSTLKIIFDRCVFCSGA